MHIPSGLRVGSFWSQSGVLLPGALGSTICCLCSNLIRCPLFPGILLNDPQKRGDAHLCITVACWTCCHCILSTLTKYLIIKYLWLHEDQSARSHTPHGVKSWKEKVFPKLPPKFLVVNRSKKKTESLKNRVKKKTRVKTLLTTND